MGTLRTRTIRELGVSKQVSVAGVVGGGVYAKGKRSAVCLSRLLSCLESECWLQDASLQKQTCLRDKSFLPMLYSKGVY